MPAGRAELKQVVYEVRFFDRSGRFSHARALECPGDDEAVDRIADLPRHYAMELWAADRLVRRFEARE